MSEIISDEKILDLLAEGDTLEAGFRFLVSKYQEKLYWHIRRIVIDHHDTDDVLQNTFLKVYRYIDKFERKSKLYTWLYRIASNESITHINKKNKKRTIGIDDEEVSIGNKLEADPYFDGNEIQMKLVSAINTLPDKQKQVFNFRYYEEMTYADISGILGTSIGGLKASYHIAAKKIEAHLKMGIQEY